MADDNYSGGDALESGPTPDDVIDADEIERLLGGGDDPDDERAPEEEEEDEEDSDDEDSDSDDDSDEDEDEDDEEDEEKSKKQAKGKPGKDYQDLLAKYGGDPDAMAQAVWANAREKSDAAKETKELRRSLEDLKDELKTLREGKPSGEKLPPEVAEIASEVQTLQQDLKEHLADQKEALDDIQERADTIKELNGEIRATPAEKRAPLVARLERLTDQYNQKVRDFKKDKKDGAKIQRAIDDKQKQVARVQATVEQKKQNEKEAQAKSKEAQQQEGKLFTNLVNENFLALAVPRDRYGDFYDQVSDAVQSSLRRGIARGETKPVDLAELVADKSMRQARLMGIEPKRRQTVGERKLESLKRLGRAGAAQHRTAAPAGDRRPAKKKGDALSKLSPHEQAAFFKKRARALAAG